MKRNMRKRNMKKRNMTKRGAYFALCGVIAAGGVVSIPQNISNVLSQPQVVLAAESKTTASETSVSSVTVLNSESMWKYLDNGTDPAMGTIAQSKWGQYTGWTRKYGDGSSYKNFNDDSWEESNGVFSTENGVLDSESSAYFFRSYFTVENPSDIYGLCLNFDYKDAAIIYVNGQQLTSVNVPESGYKTEDEGSGSHKDNLGYGSEVELDEEENACIYLRDISDMLVSGTNVIAVELHKTDEDSSAYFKFNELTLNPDESLLPERESLKSFSLTIGSEITSLNASWYSLSNAAGKFQIAEKSMMTTEEFPEYAAMTFEADMTLTQAGIYFSNQAEIAGLKEGTEYVYRFGNDGEWSETYTTETGIDDNSFSFAFAGDPQLGSSGDLSADKDGWKNTLSILATNDLFSDLAFLQNAGDHVEVSTNETQYDAYLSNNSDSLIYSLPFATAVGNHDNSGTSYNTHFALPNVSTLGNGGENNADGDYYYTYENTLFMVLNSNNQSAAEHEEFMKDAISKNPDVQWKVVVFHHSIYSTASHAVDTDILSRRDKLVPVFTELDIDVVLMGHDHVYTRSYVMNGLEADLEASLDENGNPVSEVTDPDGTVYITANSASGSKYYELSSNISGNYVAVKNQEHVANITKINVTDESFNIVTYRMSDLSIVDEFTINKSIETEEEPTEEVTEESSEEITEEVTEETKEESSEETSEDTTQESTEEETDKDDQVSSIIDNVRKVINSILDLIMSFFKRR